MPYTEAETPLHGPVMQLYPLDLFSKANQSSDYSLAVVVAVDCTSTSIVYAQFAMAIKQRKLPKISVFSDAN